MFTKKRNIIFFMSLVVFSLVVFVITGCERIGLQPPITVTFRHSLLDTTRVLQVTNKSNSETLVMKIDVQNDQKNEHGSHVFKVRPGDTYEIGRLEMGWVFEPGETYSIEADGYPISVSGTVP